MKNPFYIDSDLSKNLYLHRSFGRTENIIDFYEETDQTEQQTEFLGKAINTASLYWLIVLIILGFGVLGFRLYYLQAQRSDYYSLLAEGNSVRRFTVPATRGIIFDHNGEMLVKNIPRFAIYLTVADLPVKIAEQDAEIKKIATLIDLPDAAIKEIINNQRLNKNIYQSVVLKDNLSYEQVLKLQIALKELAGININTGQQREYLAGNNFSAILGYLGRLTNEEYNDQKTKGYLFNDVIGKTGLENYYETKLRGINGIDEVEVDALGKRKKILNSIKPIAGANLYLSLDLELQNQVSKIIQTKLVEMKLHRASAVILNPQTGEILTLLSLPTYDNNIFAGKIDPNSYQQLITDPDQPLFFRAIAGEYPSGSTIKPVWAAAALQEKIITARTTIMSTGGVQVGQWFFPDWKAGGHGLVDVKKSLADSVNTFYYYISGGYENFTGLGINKMKEYAELFNLGQTTGLDFPGEHSGFFPTPEWKREKKAESWYIGDTYHVGIGQGDLLVTPLQVAVWTAFFANNGKIIKPHLVNKIMTNEKTDLIEPTIVRENFIDQKLIAVVKAGLRQGVTQGSSRSLNDLPIAVSGKTGTAQTGHGDDSHAWWIGFAPSEQPQIAIMILVDDGGEGSKVATPIAKEILKWWIENRYK